MCFFKFLRQFGFYFKNVVPKNSWFQNFFWAEKFVILKMLGQIKFIMRRKVAFFPLCFIDVIFLKLFKFTWIWQKIWNPGKSPSCWHRASWNDIPALWFMDFVYHISQALSNMISLLILKPPPALLCTYQLPVQFTDHVVLQDLT